MQRARQGQGRAPGRSREPPELPGVAQSNREQRGSVKGHCVHRAKMGMLELSSSRMTNTSSTLSALSWQSLQRAMLQQVQSLLTALQHKTWLSFHPLADPTLVKGCAGTPHAPSISPLLPWHPWPTAQQTEGVPRKIKNCSPPSEMRSGSCLRVKPSVPTAGWSYL